jgi:hypothetical protein
MERIMPKDITPEGSIVPVYLDPTPKAQQDADAIADAQRAAAAEAKATAKAALLERLGITADEAALLLS